jgi:hypothetical protein
VVGELQRLVAEEPLREALWSHLIIALYRSGRQADALGAYQQCRRTLDEQLGIEPSPALRKLESAVLQQSPALDWQTPSPASPPQDVSLAGERAALRATLDYRDANGRLHVFQLDTLGSRVVLGREATADIWLSWDVRISRRHAELECRSDHWVVVDDGYSSNGSFVNEERVVGSRALADGDEVRFGETVMTFRLPLESASAETFLGE